MQVSRVIGCFVLAELRVVLAWKHLEGINLIDVTYIATKFQDIFKNASRYASALYKFCKREYVMIDGGFLGGSLSWVFCIMRDPASVRQIRGFRNQINVLMRDWLHLLNWHIQFQIPTCLRCLYTTTLGRRCPFEYRPSRTACLERWSQMTSRRLRREI